MPPEQDLEAHARAAGEGRAAQHAGGSPDARHGPVQRDQQPDGRRQHHHDGGPPLRPRRVPRPRSSSTRINSTSIVGDAFAKPILRALDAEPDRWDISSLRVIVSSGVMWSKESQGRSAASQPPADHGRLTRLERGDRHGDEHDHVGVRTERRNRQVRARDRTRGSSPTTGATSSPARANSAVSRCAGVRRSATTRTRPSRPRRSW